MKTEELELTHKLYLEVGVQMRTVLFDFITTKKRDVDLPEHFGTIMVTEFIDPFIKTKKTFEDNEEIYNMYHSFVYETMKQFPSII